MDDQIPEQLLARIARVARDRGTDPTSMLEAWLERASEQGPFRRDDWQSAAVAEVPWPDGFRSELGTLYAGDSRRLVNEVLEAGSVDLIMTSPPFALTREKAYGNETADQYCDWFHDFAVGFKRVLKDSGSLVIDIGGAYKKGLPVREIYQFELLRMLVRDLGFHLCLEHFWLNPSKMPSPAEWTTVRRIRPKDSVNMVFWLSKTPWPKADPKRVLSPYTTSMRDLLQRKKKNQAAYWSQGKGHTRPSGHRISDVWDREYAGSIPSTLLAVPNTQAKRRYREYCAKHGYEVHPARFPPTLPEYFIRMLTDRGDMVLDPFGGSCTTGVVSERLGRRWACADLSESYLRGAVGRFVTGEAEAPDVAGGTPMALIDAESAKVAATRSRLERQLERLERAQQANLDEPCSDAVKKTIHGALRTTISQVQLDLKTPDFRWRTEAVSIAPPCSLEIDDSRPMDPTGGKRSGD